MKEGHLDVIGFVYICIYIYKYLEPQMAIVLNGEGLVLGTLTFKNRGHLGSRYTLYTHIYIYRYTIYIPGSLCLLGGCITASWGISSKRRS